MMATTYSFEPQQATTPGRRSTPLLVVGIVLLVAGVLGGVGLWIAASTRLDDSVTGLARAPIGCTTTLNFSETGEFLIFVETSGELDGVRGDCDAAGAYDYAGDDPPSVALLMTDPDGNDLDLALRSGVDYDAAGFTGRSERVVEITTTGDHLLTVESDDEAFAIALGKDPNAGVATLRLGAVLVAGIGLIAGVVCIAVGGRRRSAPAPVAPPGWPVAPSWPSAPHGGPVGPTGTPFPPAGPPQAWPTRPPVVRQPPPQSPGTEPVTWSPAPSGQQPMGGSQAAGPGGRPSSPGGLAGPRPATGDGSTGDGERSLWAPPQEE